MRIIETDNFDGDYPNESFVNLPSLPLEAAERLADIINGCCSGATAHRYWRVVDNDYKLQPGFEP